MTVKIVGDEIATALRDWVSEDIKESPRSSRDLGKFFFTVSIGTIGAITALVKTGLEFRMTLTVGASLAVLLISLVGALVMVIPSKDPMDANTELQAAYQRNVDKIIFRCRLWFALWLIGTLLGGAAIFSGPSSSATKGQPALPRPPVLSNLCHHKVAKTPCPSTPTHSKQRQLRP